MYRINFVLAGLGLLMVGCSQSATPTTENASPPTTVTANKPPATEPLPAEETATETESAQQTPPAEETAPVEQPAQPDASPAAEPQGEKPQSEESQDEAAEERAKRELSEAGEALADWAAETKAKLIEKAEQRLAELDEQIAKLDEQSRDLKDDAKARWEEKKQQLDERRQEFSQLVDQLKDSSGDAWEKMLKGIAQAFADLKDAAKSAAAEFENDSE